MSKGKITLQSLAEIMSEKTDRSKSSSEQFLRNFFSIIKEALGKDNIVKIKGFGTFKMVVVNARESVNVNTGKRVSISEYNKITFTPDKNLKERINRPFAQFDSVLIDDEDISIINEHNDKLPDQPVETPAENIESETTVKEEFTPVATENETAPQTIEATSAVDETVENEPETGDSDQEEDTPAKSHFGKYCAFIFVGIIVGLLVGLAFSHFYSTNLRSSNAADKKAEAGLHKKPQTQKPEKTATTPLQEDSLSIKQNKSIDDYPQLSDGEYYITGVKTCRRIKPDYNLRRYCLQIYGKADVIPYVLLLNNLSKEEDATIGKIIKFPVLEEKTINQ